MRRATLVKMIYEPAWRNYMMTVRGLVAVLLHPHQHNDLIMKHEILL
jgi:hypothetical protein